LRRTAAYILIGLGLVFVFLSPFVRFYSVSRVKKIPTDFYFREVATGTGSYLDPGQNFKVVGPVPIRDIRIQKGDPRASTKTVAVWDGFDSLFDARNSHQITYEIDRFTLERTTAVSVNCCGQDENRTGSLTQLFPIGTQKRTYPFWDSVAKKAYPIHYAGATTLFGTTVWRFHQVVPDTQIDTIKLPGKIVGLPGEPLLDLTWWYGGTTDVWVEPRTGGIVKASQKVQQWFKDSNDVRLLTVADIDAGWNDPTVEAAVDKANTQASQLKVLESVIPIVTPIVGLVLVAVGVLLLVRSPRSEAAPAEPVTAST
jgi:Porin PorA